MIPLVMGEGGVKWGVVKIASPYSMLDAIRHGKLHIAIEIRLLKEDTI